MHTHSRQLDQNLPYLRQLPPRLCPRDEIAAEPFANLVAHASDGPQRRFLIGGAGGGRVVEAVVDALGAAEEDGAGLAGVITEVLASSATATLPPDRRSPMMPEPTTAASNIEVPTASAVNLLDRLNSGLNQPS
jgi:hypothetical protein